MISTQDLFLLVFLAFLEGVLSIDNAVVLAMMARHLPHEQQRKALSYGLLGSVVFRLIALGMAVYLIKWRWIKLMGGAYLLYVAGAHLVKRGGHDETSKAAPRSFWKTVFMIEVMDIAFAVDSILAAVAITPKFWIIFSGGMLGVLMIRFAASFFLKLLKRFPRFETAAYLMILVIGSKLCIDWLHLPGIDFESAHSPSFWLFWGLMAGGFGFGFVPRNS